MAWNLGGHYCAALIAKRTARPVKWVFSRREDFYGGEMDVGVYYFKVGFNNDGTILAVKSVLSWSTNHARLRHRQPHYR